MKINSIIFHTTRLSEVREFYEEKLNLSTGTYVKENKTVPDFDDTYVNYYIDGSLLCFEGDSERTDMGTIVLSVSDLEAHRARIEKAGVSIVAGNDQFFKVKDPEGRSLIFEPVRQ